MLERVYLNAPDTKLDHLGQLLPGDVLFTRVGKHGDSAYPIDCANGFTDFEGLVLWPRYPPMRSR
ncbi:MAG: hypothetical protein MUC88_25395 [Planctomycetes bacterium]|nr:hypothetical protein [Planctomycetota bacterium]